MGDLINPLSGNPISQLPFVDANGGIVDQDSLMAMLALGFKPTESLRLELGGGYLGTKDDADTPINRRMAVRFCDRFRLAKNP